MPGKRWRCAVVLTGLLLAASTARADSRQEKKRDDILRDLGLKKKPPAPPADSGAVAPAPGSDTPVDGPDAPASAPGKQPGKDKDKSGAATKTSPAAAPAAPSFGRVVFPLFVASCKPCHAPGLPGGASRLLLSGDAAADHKVIVRFVNTRDAEASPLLGKVSGATMHAGGAPWPATGAQYQRVLAWIRGGARLDAAARAEPVADTAAPRVPAAPPPRRPQASAAGVSPAPPTPGPQAAGQPATATPPAVDVATPAAAAPPTAAAPIAAPPTKSSAPSFAASVHPVLTGACAICHRPGGPAAMSRLVLSGDAATDEAIARTFIDMQAPEQSLLVTKAKGEMHAGGAVLAPGDVRLNAIVAWATASAAAQAATASPAPVAVVPGAPLAAPAAITPATASPASGASAPHARPYAHGGPGGPGFALPLGFMLNGRFSLDYERRQFSGDPFEAASVNALRSYHHFLFLSHDSAGDPCGLSVEVLTLQFWEAHCRVPHLPAPVRVTVAGGKIVVPFGADPLYHQNYGGLGGFDQPILPVIWAVEGVAAHVIVERRAFVLTDDVFVIRGYDLAHADSIINLQNDFSPVDATKIGWGNRLGASWMFVSAWYSAYYNPLGFGRRLFMQAFDLTVWRPRGIPVAQHFSLGTGFLHADVSGGGDGVGGVGLDYYHFGSYLQARYHPTDWLYIQYRQGLRSFNNRRGVTIDNTRLTSDDASTHNFAVVARHRGLTAGLYYFINLEKVDEIANDLFRLSVTYDF